MEEEWKFWKETKYSNRYCEARIYEVSNKGRVKINGVITEPYTDQGGYKRIGGFYVHRAVAELFIPNPENKPFVDHIDTNPSNNMFWNLRWVTYKENNNNLLTRQHMSDAQNRPETRRKKSKSQKVAQNRPETRQKHSESMKGKHKDRCWINKDNARRFIKKDQLDTFINEGWKIGRISRKNKV